MDNNRQKQLIETKVISNYKWLLEELEKELSELQNITSIEEKERVIKRSEWTISEFLKSNRNNLFNLRKIRKSALVKR